MLKLKWLLKDKHVMSWTVYTGLPLIQKLREGPVQLMHQI